MREIDVFKDVIRNMVEGTMFHNQMIQYFEYLGLSGFAELQKIRFEDENNEMVKLQQEAEKTCNAILLLDGWQWSKGVKLELKTAIENDFQFLVEEDFEM
jgi:hypothetical protein